MIKLSKRVLRFFKMLSVVFIRRVSCCLAISEDLIFSCTLDERSFSILSLDKMIEKRISSYLVNSSVPSDSNVWIDKV